MVLLNPISERCNVIVEVILNCHSFLVETIWEDKHIPVQINEGHSHVQSLRVARNENLLGMWLTSRLTMQIFEFKNVPDISSEIDP